MTRSEEFQTGQSGDRFERMPLDHLLKNYEAGDPWDMERPVIERLPGGGLRHGPQDWGRVFEGMDAERQGSYWDEFKAHVAQHGIQRPVVLEGGKVRSGHHRIWAAKALGLKDVPVVHTEEPDRWIDEQAMNEEDWRKR